MSTVFDDNANVYDAWFTDNAKLFDSEFDAINSIIDKDKTYVEVGVGTGLFARRLGIKEGVEPSEEMGKIATSRGINVLSGVAEHLPYSDASLEGIVMITVDCFVKDIMAVFDEIHRVLEPNGSFIMAFLDRESPLGHEYEANKDNDEFYRDATFRSSDEMQKYLADAHFEVEKMCQSVYTLENKYQPYSDGHGKGVFAIIKAKRR